MKNLNELASALCYLEGKKKQVDRAQMKEILKCLKLLIKEHPIDIIKMLLK